MESSFAKLQKEISRVTKELAFHQDAATSDKLFLECCLIHVSGTGMGGGKYRLQCRCTEWPASATGGLMAHRHHSR